MYERLCEAWLKLKLSKCTFFKKHLQYLGHLISAKGICPIQEREASLLQLLPPKDVTELDTLSPWLLNIKNQSKFRDIIRPFNELTKRNTLSFGALLAKLIWHFQYNPNKQLNFNFPHLDQKSVFHTNASEYSWWEILTQERTTVVNNDEITKLHPITYISRIFLRSKKYWATLTKEVYAITYIMKK